VDRNLSVRRVLYALVGLWTIMLVGTIAFHHVLHESWLKALYRSIVTSSLTGLDSPPRGTAAEVLTIALVLAGVAIFGYVGAIVVESIARGVLTGAWAERRRRRAIERLRDHYIICGYGRVGQRVADEFRESGASYVVLDFSEEAVEAAGERGDLFIAGNGTEDEDLAAAGLADARGLVASSDSDADNLYITLSARAARPDLFIVARASDEDAERKMHRAGADRVVLPYATAGRVIANLMLKPQVAAFLNVVSTAAGPDLRFEEIEVKRTCAQAGKTIRDLRVRERTGAMIIAVRKPDGTFDTRPAPDTVLGEGDVMVGVGSDEEIKALEQLFAPREAFAR
jgi:voltage-gated potassium channel